MDQMVILTDRKRAQYNRVLAHLKALGYNGDPSSLQLSESDLRIEKVLKSSDSSLSFNPKEGASLRSLEMLLNQNDLFFVTGILLCIQKVTPASNDFANRPIFTYPDTNYFLGAGEAAALETLYQSEMSIQTDGVTRIKKFSTHNFKHVPETAYEPALVTGQVSGPEYPAYAGAKEYYMIEPNFVLDGSKSNSIDIAFGLGDRAGIEGGAGDDNVAIMFLKGFLFSGQHAGGTCQSF